MVKKSKVAIQPSLNTVAKLYTINHKFCKAVLGIKKTSCNISAKSELGRLPLDSFIKHKLCSTIPGFSRME